MLLLFLYACIGGSPDYASCLVHSRLCRSDLDSAGFFVNLQKSVWEPSQVGTWLGFYLDFSLNFITVPLPKITKLQERISRILALRFVNAKDLASVAGQLNSIFLAIGNIVRLMSRAMYAQISAQNSWFSNFYLEDSVVEELVFWQSNFDHLNGRRIWFKSSAVRVAYSDASDTGYGGYIVELGPQVTAQGVWSADLAKESSTMREIWPLEKFCNLLRLSLQDYVSNGTRTTRMLRVLLVSVAGSLVCKAKLSVFLRFVFIMAFLLSQNGFPDPVMSKQII